MKLKQFLISFSGHVILFWSLKSTARLVQGPLAGCYCRKISLNCDSASVISEAYLTCVNEKQKEMPGGKSSYVHLVAGG